MLVNILVGILAVIGGFVVLVVFMLVVLYFVLARRMTLRVRKYIDGIYPNAPDGVIDSDDVQDADWPEVVPDIPPLSIELEPTDQIEWWDPALIDKVTQRLKKSGFEIVGDYLVETEEDSAKRFFLGEDSRVIAVVHQDPNMEEPYIDFTFELTAGGRGGVGNPPNCTIDLPDGVVGKHFSRQLSDGMGVITKMLTEVRKLIAVHPAKQLRFEEVATRFQQAYNEDMLWRIKNGGVSEKEIRQTLEMQGVEPDEDTIGGIQESWQDAIEDFLIDRSRRALEQDEEGHEVLAVHDGSLKDYLLMRLRDFLINAIEDDHDGAEQMLDELKQLLNRFSPREAIARFRPLLPQPIRFALIEQLKAPVETDFYMLPEVD